MGIRVEAAILTTIVLLSCLYSVNCQGADPIHTTLILEYEDEAVQAEKARSDVSTASVEMAAAQAADSARFRGASPARRAEIVTTASLAAAVSPAVQALTYSMYRDATAKGIEVTGITNYATVMQGASIRTNSSDSAAALKEQLERNPKVKKVWYAGARQLVMPVGADDRPLSSLPGGAAQPMHNAENDLDLEEDADTLNTSGFIPQSATDGNSVATQLETVKRLDPELDGTGQLVCIIDTGISFIGNALYGNCKALNTPKGQCKVVAGYDFVGDAYTGLQTGPSAIRGGQPTDCMGHGTMVASVAGTSNGVAPGAVFGSYRVFGCSGYATDDVLIESIDRAVRDGCDVINLSLATGSGYADWSVFNPVMKNAISKGVIVVKAAGNSGRDGPFNADVATAAGAITLASVGSAAGDPVDKKVVMSRFSSIGPAPDLTLVPSVAAPGAFIQVKTMTDDATYVSGTSFSSPYTAGLLAMWLQAKQKQAAIAGVSPEPETVNQEAALRSLVATAKSVKDPMKPSWVEPVARMGAGMIQAHAFMTNKARLDPIMVQLPSNLHAPYSRNITLSWSGVPQKRPVAFELVHTPAVAMSLEDGWYGTTALKREYLSASVYFDRDTVVMDTSRAKHVTFQVTFTLPEALRKEPLLYSGLLELQSDNPSVPSLVVPYQGFSQPMSNLRVPAHIDTELDIIMSAQLEKLHNSLCYAPRSKPKFVNAILDAQAAVPNVCSGGFASQDNVTIDVSLTVLQASPECSLRVTVVPELSLRALRPILTDQAGAVIGTLTELDMSSGNSLGTAGEVWSTCLHFNGNYIDTKGRQTQLQVSKVYKLKVDLYGPLAAADIALGLKRPVTRVDIRGRFRVRE